MDIVMFFKILKDTCVLFGLIGFSFIAFHLKSYNVDEDFSDLKKLTKISVGCNLAILIMLLPSVL